MNFANLDYLDKVCVNTLVTQYLISRDKKFTILRFSESYINRAGATSRYTTEDRTIRRLPDRNFDAYDFTDVSSADATYGSELYPLYYLTGVTVNAMEPAHRPDDRVDQDAFSSIRMSGYYETDTTRIPEPCARNSQCKFCIIPAEHAVATSLIMDHAHAYAWTKGVGAPENKHNPMLVRTEYPPIDKHGIKWFAASLALRSLAEGFYSEFFDFNTETVNSLLKGIYTTFRIHFCHLPATCEFSKMIHCIVDIYVLANVTRNTEAYANIRDVYPSTSPMRFDMTNAEFPETLLPFRESDEREKIGAIVAVAAQKAKIHDEILKKGYMDTVPITIDDVSKCNSNYVKPETIEEDINWGDSSYDETAMLHRLSIPVSENKLSQVPRIAMLPYLTPDFLSLNTLSFALRKLQYLSTNYVHNNFSLDDMKPFHAASAIQLVKEAFPGTIVTLFMDGMTRTFKRSYLDGRQAIPLADNQVIIMLVTDFHIYIKIVEFHQTLAFSNPNWITAIHAKVPPALHPHKTMRDLLIEAFCPAGYDPSKILRFVVLKSVEDTDGYNIDGSDMIVYNTIFFKVLVKVFNMHTEARLNSMIDVTHLQIGKKTYQNAMLSGMMSEIRKRHIRTTLTYTTSIVTGRIFHTKQPSSLVVPGPQILYYDPILWALSPCAFVIPLVPIEYNLVPWYTEPYYYDALILIHNQKTSKLKRLAPGNLTNFLPGLEIHAYSRFLAVIETQHGPHKIYHLLINAGGTQPGLKEIGVYLGPTSFDGFFNYVAKYTDHDLSLPLNVEALYKLERYILPYLTSLYSFFPNRQNAETLELMRAIDVPRFAMLHYCSHCRSLFTVPLDCSNPDIKWT